ncbi:MAG: beta-ketoacyl-ACP synthase II [Oligoflexia bacterium]|nr:beta-ketoacyl-ACP synthase II [Oligoflexia bacterium]
MKTKRVVITGMGQLTPYGDDLDKFWNSIAEGKSAISRIENFDASEFSVRIAGEIKSYDFEKHISAKDIKKMDRFVQIGMVASNIAIADSGLVFDEKMQERCGVFAASGIGGLYTLQDNYRKFLDKGPRRISPMFIPMVLSNLLPGNISMAHSLKGPNISIVSACASGAHCIGHAYLTILEDRADFMVAGAAEAAICELGVGGFASMRALSTRNDEPVRASRPWDRDRDGFVMAEGAAFVVLEEYEHARKRGAKIYAEVVGYGMSADAYHITQPSDSGDGAERCLREALKDANIAPEKIDYINAHGTATPLGDIAESNAMKRVFAGCTDRISVTSSKSMTGHLLGTAGSLEVLITALSIKKGVVTPTINLDNVDERCEGLDFTPHASRERKIEYGLSNSFGFGGTNCSVVLRKI